MQANWADAEDEVAWVQGPADESGFPHAIVGYADLMAKDVRPALDKLKKYPLMRGVRMQLHWHANEQYRFASRPDLADDPAFRRNFSALADYDLSFDLQVFASQMAGAAKLAADFPKTTFILQHAGMPEDLSEAGRAAWRKGMQLLAAQPNVVSKTSALGTFIHRNDPAHIAGNRERDGRALRGGALSLRLELPDREAVDRLPRASRRASRCDLRPYAGRAARDSPRQCGARVPDGVGYASAEAAKASRRAGQPESS